MCKQFRPLDRSILIQEQMPHVKTHELDLCVLLSNIETCHIENKPGSLSFSSLPIHLVSRQQFSKTRPCVTTIVTRIAQVASVLRFGTSGPERGSFSYRNGVERVPDLRIGRSLLKGKRETEHRQSRGRHGRNKRKKRGRKILNNENLI